MLLHSSSVFNELLFTCAWGGGHVWANGGKRAGKGLVKGYERPLGKELGEEGDALTR
mgnify:CR=1 FL=1